jgi:hypothetical protein
VQGQTLAFSIQDNSTPLKTAINAFGFAGVLIDVVSAFLALLSSTFVQSSIDRMDQLRDVLAGYTFDQLKELLEWEQFKDVVPKTRMERQFLLEAHIRIQNFQEKSDSGIELATTPQTLGAQRDVVIESIRPRHFVIEMRKAGERIVTFSIIGDAAGTAMLLGIICFLVSLVCLATDTQPPAVWISAIVACSCIVILPASNCLLATIHLRVSFRFS